MSASHPRPKWSGARALHVEIEGSPALGPQVRQVELHPVTFRARANGRVRQRRGQARLQFDPNLLAERELREWVDGAAQGECAPKNITITVLDQTGDTVRTFVLRECFPTKFSFLDLGVVAQPGGMIVHWGLEVRINRVDMA